MESKQFWRILHSFYLIFILKSMQLGLVDGQQVQVRQRRVINCPILPDRTLDNVDLKCRRSLREGSVNCSRWVVPQPPESIVEYGCPKYFRLKPGVQFSSSDQRTISCNSYGKWVGFTEFMKFACVPECGKNGNSVGGAPWQVLILKNRRTETCEGTLIPGLVGNPVILTSRDCITGSNGTQLSSKDLRVSIGRSQLFVDSLFVPNDHKVNIAILNVTMEIDLSEKVLPICLPFDTTHVGDLSLGNKWAAGDTGIILDSESIGELKLVVISSETCESLGYSPQRTEFCAIKPDNDNSPMPCPNVNGPFVLKKFPPNGSPHQIYEVHGIPGGTLRVNSCHPGAVYTNIQSFQKWISQTLRTISGISVPSDPGCDGMGCGPNSLCKRNGTYSHCVCETGWARDINGQCTNSESGGDRVQGSAQRPTKNPIRTTAKPNRQPFPWASGCPPLRVNSTTGLQVDCTIISNESHRSQRVDCLSENIPVGTSGIYTCKKYFEPPESYGSSLFATTVCQTDGTWTNLTSDFKCNLSCGKLHMHNPTHEEEDLVKWPWVAALYETEQGAFNSTGDPNSFTFTCGGSLVSQNAILTAAHCVTTLSSSRPRPKQASNLRVVLGDVFKDHFRQKRPSQRFSQEFRVKDIHIHSDYNPFIFTNDIAFLILSRPVQITEAVLPVCLPHSEKRISLLDFPAVGSNGTLPGWGKIGSGTFSVKLTEINLPVVPDESCKENDEELTDIVLPPKNFCAGNLNGSAGVAKVACSGHQGSGLYFQTKKGQVPSGYSIMGISSWIPDTKGGQCNKNIYSVFTRVSAFTTWIKSILDPPTLPVPRAIT